MPDIKTQGTKLKVESSTSPGEYLDVPGIASIDGLGSGEADDIDVTDFDSTGKEFLVGLKDEGTLTCQLNYDPDNAVHTLLETLQNSQTKTNFKIQLPAGTNDTFSFEASVKQFNKSLQANDAVRATLQLRISGSVSKGAS